MTDWKTIKSHPKFLISNEGAVCKASGDPVKPDVRGTRHYFYLGEMSGQRYPLSTLMKENWRYEWIKDLEDDEEAKEVIGFPGYFITNKARIYSEKTNQWLLKSEPGRFKDKEIPHVVVTLKGNQMSLSRLVGKHFLPDFDENLQVLHTNEKLPWPEVNYANNLHMGTQSTNIEECSKKGRLPARKLTNDQVIEIRQRLINGELRQSIAREFGMSANSIKKIQLNQSYKWIK